MPEQAAVQLWLNFAGQANSIIPRDGRLYCPDNTLAEVSAAGFLDSYLKANGVGLLASDFVLTVASDGHQIYRPTFSNGSCTLVSLP